MKKLFITLFLAVMSVSAGAYDVFVDGIYYNLNNTDNTASVTYKIHYEKSYSGSLTIPSSITYSGVTYSVTSIDNEALYGCRGLISIVIPNSVTFIGDRAFSECTGLASINIPDGIKFYGLTFNGCTSLPVEGNIRYADTYLVEAVDKTQASYTIKKGTRYIGSAAFSDCTNLTHITIPNSVSFIGHTAFNGCTGLSEIHSNNMTPPTVDSPVFNNVQTSQCKLYVPVGSRESYQWADGWGDFVNIIEEEVKNTDGEQCAMPTIALVNGNLSFKSATPGAKYHYTIKANTNDANCTSDEELVKFSPVTTYTVTCYASADGYADSETATATITIDKADVNSDGSINVNDVNDVINKICRK